MKLYPRLRTILFIVNMSVMLLPLGGLTFLRVYETEMIRQKEGSLHSQGAYMSSMFRREIADSIGIADGFQEPNADLTHFGLPLQPGVSVGFFPQTVNLTKSSEYEVIAQKTRDPHRGYHMSKLPAEPATQNAGNKLLPIILRAQNLNMDQVWVVDHNGVVVASSLGEEGRSLISWEEAQRALQGESVSLLRRIRPLSKRRSPLESIFGLGEPQLLYVAVPTVIGNRVVGAVIVSGSPSHITQFLYGNKGKLLNAFAILLLVVTLITLLSSLTISEPIQALIDQTKSISQGKPAGLTPIKWPILREINQLSTSLASMAKAISDRSEYITSFARNVSHEFKTPLAGMRGTIEILRDEWKEMKDSDRERFFSNLDRDATRLSNLVTGLLAFARAEVTTPTTKSLDVSHAINEIAGSYDSALVTINVTSSNSSYHLNMTQDLFETMTRNIIQNVINHCPKGTELKIGVHPLDEKLCEIVFSDNGPGISAANLEKLKTPFFTTARSSGGTGLGLSIVRAIVKSHNGHSEITSELGVGTTIRLQLPYS